MKKTCYIQSVAILLCLIMICSIPVYATEDRASERIYRSNVVLAKSDNNDLNMYFSVVATGRMDVVGASSVEVQRYSLLGWTTEYTFTPDDTPELQTKGETRHNATLTYSPKYTGKSYRVIVMIYVENASGVSTKKLTSESVVIE